MAGWQVYASAGPEKRMYVYFRPPGGSKSLKSLRELDTFLLTHPQELPHDTEVQSGAFIEAEMIDEDTNEKEWIRGKVEKRNKNSFQVRFSEANEDEPFEWSEEYKMKDKGTEWRWPILSRQDFEESIKSAKDACQQVNHTINRESIVAISS
jgi:hypothetical protein